LAVAGTYSSAAYATMRCFSAVAVSPISDFGMDAGNMNA
jgi:hypothetical protein